MFTRPPVDSNTTGSNNGVRYQSPAPIPFGSGYAQRAVLPNNPGRPNELDWMNSGSYKARIDAKVEYIVRLRRYLEQLGRNKNFPPIENVPVTTAPSIACNNGSFANTSEQYSLANAPARFQRAAPTGTQHFSVPNVQQRVPVRFQHTSPMTSDVSRSDNQQFTRTSQNEGLSKNQTPANTPASFVSPQNIQNHLANHQGYSLMNGMKLQRPDNNPRTSSSFSNCNPQFSRQSARVWNPPNGMQTNNARFATDSGTRVVPSQGSINYLQNSQIPLPADTWPVDQNYVYTNTTQKTNVSSQGTVKSLKRKRSSARENRQHKTKQIARTEKIMYTNQTAVSYSNQQQYENVFPQGYRLDYQTKPTTENMNPHSNGQTANRPNIQFQNGSQSNFQKLSYSQNVIVGSNISDHRVVSNLQNKPTYENLSPQLISPSANTLLVPQANFQSMSNEQMLWNSQSIPGNGAQNLLYERNFNNGNHEERSIPGQRNSNFQNIPGSEISRISSNVTKNQSIDNLNVEKVNYTFGNKNNDSIVPLTTRSNSLQQLGNTLDNDNSIAKGTCFKLIARPPELFSQIGESLENQRKTPEEQSSDSNGTKVDDYLASLNYIVKEKQPSLEATPETLANSELCEQLSGSETPNFGSASGWIYRQKENNTMSENDITQTGKEPPEVMSKNLENYEQQVPPNNALEVREEVPEVISLYSDSSCINTKQDDDVICLSDSEDDNNVKVKEEHLNVEMKKNDETLELQAQNPDLGIERNSQSRGFVSQSSALKVKIAPPGVISLDSLSYDIRRRILAPQASNIDSGRRRNSSMYGSSFQNDAPQVKEKPLDTISSKYELEVHNSVTSCVPEPDDDVICLSDTEVDTVKVNEEYLPGTNENNSDSQYPQTEVSISLEDALKDLSPNSLENIVNQEHSPDSEAKQADLNETPYQRMDDYFSLEEDVKNIPEWSSIPDDQGSEMSPEIDSEAEKPDSDVIPYSQIDDYFSPKEEAKDIPEWSSIQDTQGPETSPGTNSEAEKPDSDVIPYSQIDDYFSPKEEAKDIPEWSSIQDTQGPETSPGTNSEAEKPDSDVIPYSEIDDYFSPKEEAKDIPEWSSIPDTKGPETSPETNTETFGKNSSDINHEVVNPDENLRSRSSEEPQVIFTSTNRSSQIGKNGNNSQIYGITYYVLESAESTKENNILPNKSDCNNDIQKRHESLNRNEKSIVEIVISDDDEEDLPSSDSNKTKAAESGDEAFILNCPHCDKQFDSRLKYTRHIITHLDDQRKYACSECGKIYVSRYRFNQHMLTHGEEKTFRCDVCEFKTWKKRNLKSHKLRHAEKTMECNICGKMFNDKHLITMHIAFRHLTAKERRVILTSRCKVCKKRFLSKTLLRRHMVVHTGAKDFKCDTCDMEFTQKASVVRHKSVVHAKKNCETCPAET